jgi:hypothetical protein
MTTIVVFYSAKEALPLREANLSHLMCWRRHSSFRTIYVNAAFPIPWKLLNQLSVQAVIFDTIFLSMHWAPDYFRERSDICLPASKWRCPKIAIAQDEFINMEYVVQFLKAVQVSDVLTFSKSEDWATIYSGLDLEQVNFKTVLTGYVDELRLKRLAPDNTRSRDIQIGYRAWNNPYWLGAHGLQKVIVGQKFADTARKRGMKVDINNPESQDFLIGIDWFDFLSRCQTVLGVEGGASVIDRDGAVRERVERFLELHPHATFSETRDACFSKEEGSAKNLRGLSPRHFEAAMTRTCQILLEGDYNGVLEPWKHYIPVKSDYSNVDEVLDIVSDQARTREIAERAYADLIESGRWSYESFVRETEETIVNSYADADRPNAGFFAVPSYMALWLYERSCWHYAHVINSPIGRLVYRGRLRSINLLRSMMARFTGIARAIRNRAGI